LTIQDEVALGPDVIAVAERLTAERDRSLVEAHLRQDADAFAIIVDDHKDALIAQARRLLGPEGPVEDVVQETFERALRYLPRFGRTGEYRLRAWLSQILRSVVQNHWDRRARELKSIAAESSRHLVEPDVAEQVGDPVTAGALRDAVRALPENQRAAFVMRELVGMPYAAVADALDITEDNARARVSRSKGQLRRSTAGFRTAAGGLVGLPLGVRALQQRVQDAWRALRERSSVLSAGDRMAARVTSNPVGQTVGVVASGTPRGTLLFGLAATVATLSASTAVVVANAGLQNGPSRANVLGAAHQSALPTAPMVLGPSVAEARTSGSPARATAFAWANPAGSTGAAVIGAAAANCTPSDGVAPPTAGFSFGTPYGLSNAIAIATGPTTLPSTAPPSLRFSSAGTVAPYSATDSGTPVTMTSNLCLAGSSSWFTAVLGGSAGQPVVLRGTLQSVIGSGDPLAYIFRGTVSGADWGAVSGAVQFVAQVVVSEPANTVQVTVILLSSSSVPWSGVGPGDPGTTTGVPSSPIAVSPTGPSGSSTPGQPTSVGAPSAPTTDDPQLPTSPASPTTTPGAASGGGGSGGGGSSAIVPWS
jgi:RNA polymerase sigma-70 factor, ECF subfamily